MKTNSVQFNVALTLEISDRLFLFSYPNDNTIFYPTGDEVTGTLFIFQNIYLRTTYTFFQKNIFYYIVNEIIALHFRLYSLRSITLAQLCSN